MVNDAYSGWLMINDAYNGWLMVVIINRDF